MISFLLIKADLEYRLYCDILSVVRVRNCIVFTLFPEELKLSFALVVAFFLILGYFGTFARERKVI